MQYNELIYNSGPTNIKDYVSDRYNIVHNQLYVDALNQDTLTQVINILNHNNDLNITQIDKQ